MGVIHQDLKFDIIDDVDVGMEEAKKLHDLVGPLEDLYEDLSLYFLMEI